MPYCIIKQIDTVLEEDASTLVKSSLFSPERLQHIDQAENQMTFDHLRSIHSNQQVKDEGAIALAKEETTAKAKTMDDGSRSSEDVSLKM